MGYGNGLLSIDPGTADNVKFYTRLYPIGSSRNIDREQYGHTRLQLPGGLKYVEINAEKYGRVDHYEKDAFADIYPRRTGTVSSVRSEEKTGEDGNPFTIYYFKDEDLPFDPNDYLTGGRVMRVSFQEGSELAGLGDEEEGTYYFEVNYDSDTEEFELITIWPYDDGRQLPGETLIPKEGDRYILWNMRMPDEYYPLAEEEFLEAVEKYNADHGLDIAVYKAPTDHVWIEDNEIELSIGQRIRLESEEYFPETGYRESRITKITRKVTLPSQMDIEISDALSRTAQEKMTDSIAEARSYAETLAGSGNLPDIIKTGDRTKPTDNNLLSALRSYRDLLRKDQDDRSAGKIAADQGFEAGTFAEGISGARIDGRGNSEVESIKVRSFAQFAELIVNRQTTIEGDVIYSEGDKIEDVIAHDDGTYTLKLHPEWEGYTTAQIEHNVIRGIYNDITSRLPAGAGQTTLHNATYYTSWMRVLTVNAAANTIDVVMYPDDEVPAGKNFPPTAMMSLARWGNSGSGDDPRYAQRQHCIVVSSTEGRIMKLTNVTKPIIDIGNVAFITGALPESITSKDPRLKPGDEGTYVKNLVAQMMIQMDHLGRPKPTLVYYGPYNPDEEHYQSGNEPDEDTGEFIRHYTGFYGCLWLCDKTGTRNPPSWNSTDWTFYQGDPEFKVVLLGGPAAVNPRNFKFTLKIKAEKYNQDVTSNILPQDVVWTRYSEDKDGNERVASDTIWATSRGSNGLSIELTEADLDTDINGIPPVCVFTATVTLRDGVELTQTATYGFDNR